MPYQLHSNILAITYNALATAVQSDTLVTTYNTLEKLLSSALATTHNSQATAEQSLSSCIAMSWQPPIP